MSYIVPWVEYNQISPENFKHICEGIRLWRDSQLVRTIFISTKPGAHGLITRLRQDFGFTIRVIPGLKLTTLLTKLDDEAGWDKIAQEIQRIKDNSQPSLILLEGETASKKYIHGLEAVDLEKLKVCFSKLPPGKYLWWPMGSRNPEYQQRYLNLLQASQGRFGIISNHIASDAFIPHTDRLAFFNLCVATLQGMGQYLRTPNMLWFYGPDSPWWQDEQAKQAVQACKNHWAMVYPGFERWVEGSKNIINELKR